MVLPFWWIYHAPESSGVARPQVAIDRAAPSGGFTVTVRTAAGVGVSVGSSPDNTAVVYCDGTDVLAISSIVACPYDPAMFIPGTHGSGALMGQIGGAAGYAAAVGNDEGDASVQSIGSGLSTQRLATTSS